MLHKMIRILIADDSKIAREMVSRGVDMQRANRYIEVDVVEDGQSALDVLRAKAIDIAFIDINMPGFNGPEVVAALKTTKSKDCLTVAMSSSMDQQAEATLKHFGAYHFIRKPFHKEAINDIISSFIIMTTSYPVLIVDDSATMRKMVRKILEGSRFDFTISEADSGAAALRAVATGKFKIVLTDYHMPNGDGLELAGAIGEISSKVGVYMMSTNDTTYLERSAAFVGVSGFLKKPFTSADIDTLMHKHLAINEPRFGKVRDMFSFEGQKQKAS